MAKNLSLISKGLAIVFAIFAFIVFDKGAGEIVAVAVFIAGAFIPVDASMIVNNIKKKES